MVCLISKNTSSFIRLFVFIDTGFFSIQVLQRALKMFEIELVPFGSQESVAKQARDHPESIQAYICNLGLHWFTIRRFGNQYFNLNSFYYVPEFVFNPVLPAYLNLIKENGYSVFIVDGTLPVCLADQQLTANPINERDYTLLIKDLPKLIMDDKVIANSKDLRKGGKLVVQLPKDLYNEFLKNPDNPHIRELIYAQLPKDMIDEEIPEYARCSNPDHHHHHHHPRRQIVFAAIPERRTDEQLMGDCNCSNCRQHSQISPKHFAEQVTDDSDIDNLNESHHGTSIITEHLTQYIIEKKNSNNPNAPPQQEVITTRVVTVSRSPHKNNTLIDNDGIQRMPQSNIGFENDDDFFLQHAMAQSLLSAQGKNEDIDIPFLEDPLEKEYRRSLDEAIAASLTTNNSAIEQFVETPELIPITTMNSSPTSTMNSETVTIKMPSSLTTSSLPPTNTYSPSPTNTSSPPPTNTYSASPTNTSSPPPTNTYSPSPTNTSSPPPTNTYSPSPTNTSSPPPTNTYSAPPTNTSSPPPTNTYSPSPINTSSQPPTNTYSPSPTNTSSPPTTNTYSPSPTNTSSPPPTNTYSPSPTNTSSPPPTNTYSAPPTNTSSPPPTNTYSPSATTASSPPPMNMYSVPTTDTSSPPSATTNSPPSTVTNSDFIESPSVEGKLFKTILR